MANQEPPSVGVTLEPDLRPAAVDASGVRSDAPALISCYRSSSWSCSLPWLRARSREAVPFARRRLSFHQLPACAVRGAGVLFYLRRLPRDGSATRAACAAASRLFIASSRNGGGTRSSASVSSFTTAAARDTGTPACRDSAAAYASTRSSSSCGNRKPVVFVFGDMLHSVRLCAA